VAVRIGQEPVSVEDSLARVEHPSCGGVAVFVGVVRNNDSGRRVTAIEYEAYPEMARKVLEGIETELKRMHPVKKVVLWHRTGRLRVGEASVVVAVSAPHREEAFAACREGIERIKAELPVWKKEYGAGGAVWKEEQDLRKPSRTRRKTAPARKNR